MIWPLINILTAGMSLGFAINAAVLGSWLALGAVGGLNVGIAALNVHLRFHAAVPSRRCPFCASAAHGRPPVT